MRKLILEVAGKEIDGPKVASSIPSSHACAALGAYGKAGSPECVCAFSKACATMQRFVLPSGITVGTVPIRWDTSSVAYMVELLY